MSQISDSQAESNELRRLRQLAAAKGFLGKEFLLWLWFKAESDSAWVELPKDVISSKNRQVPIWIDDRVVLEATSGHTHVHTLKGGDPSHSTEASAALQAGKSVKELKLGLEIKGIAEITCLLDAHELSPRSVQLVPSAEMRKDPLGDDEFSPLAFRLHAAELLCQVIDTLFANYLEFRTNKDSYSQLQQDLKNWVLSRVNKAETLLH
jgi:hypothetical protein